MPSLGLTLAVLTALRVPGPLSPRIASYRMHASLDEDKKVVSGREHLTWKNATDAPARELVFHLYMNAFKNEGSTFFRESKEAIDAAAREHGWGAIDVSRLAVGGVDLTARLKVDDTLGTVALPLPVAAGATVEIELDFTTKLPRVFARTGYDGDFFAVAQWFPKLGVYECGAGDPHAAPSARCAWRAHQHHATSEFFADYGMYDVELDVPARFVVGATGVLTNERSNGDRKTLTYHAEDVHDFAFAADPRFRREQTRFADAWGAVEIELLSLPGHDGNAPRHLRAAREGLAELERRLGAYPYSRVTIVDVPTGAEAAGGMEYPTLFFTLDLPVPAGLHLPEEVTLHELAHQFFHGVVASDEVEEAWLDEGLTETMTDLGLSAIFGKERSELDLLGLKLPYVELRRLSYRVVADVDPPATRAFDFLSPETYSRMSYAKTDLSLRTVEALLGPERFERALRHYYESWRFRHPRQSDFVRTFDEGAGENLSWFWIPALTTSQRLDYEVRSVESHRHRPPTGLFDVDGGARIEVARPSEADDAPWISEVVVQRAGEIVFPVDLRVTFDDGAERRLRYDERMPPGSALIGDAPLPREEGYAGGRWRRFVFEGRRPVLRAEIDPDEKIALDGSRWNNAASAEPDPVPRRRLTGMWQVALSTLLQLVGF